MSSSLEISIEKLRYSIQTHFLIKISIRIKLKNYIWDIYFHNFNDFDFCL